MEKPLKIDLVLWDYYHTITDIHYDECSDIELPPPTRQGSLELLTEINSAGITQITISDGNVENIKKSMQERGINRKKIFFDLYKMDANYQKDILNMFEYYKLKFPSLNLDFKPEKTLVIGDNYEMDIDLAKKQGCHVLHVPTNHPYNNPLPVEEIREITGL